MRIKTALPVFLAFLLVFTATALAQDAVHVPPDQALKQNDRNFALSAITLSAQHDNEFKGGEFTFLLAECQAKPQPPWRVLVITQPGSAALSPEFKQAQATGMLVMPSDQVEVVKQPNATGVTVRWDTGKHKFVLTANTAEAKKINDALAKAKAHHH